MKWLLSATILLATLAAAQQQPQQPPVADMARASRSHHPKPAKVYDNDNLPTTAPITVLGEVREPEAAAPAKPEDAANPAAPKGAAPKADEAEAAKRLQEQWHSKLADQKKEIGTLQRELDILQREYRLRVAAVYSDAGNSLRDSKKWAEDDRQYHQQIDDKAKQYDVAKQKLDDLREQARKAGMPATVTE